MTPKSHLPFFHTGCHISVPNSANDMDIINKPNAVGALSGRVVVHELGIHGRLKHTALRDPGTEYQFEECDVQW